MTLNFRGQLSRKPTYAAIFLMIASTLAVGADKKAKPPSVEKKAPARVEKGSVPAKKVPAPTPAKSPDPVSTVPAVKPNSNLNFTFIIVERSDDQGQSHRFFAEKTQASSGNTLQGFDLLINTILPEREIGDITGMLRFGDEVWKFRSRSVVDITKGRLIVNTKISVQDKQKGTAEMISKEPYRDVKIVGLREQTVTDFIDVGVKIEAQPTVLPNGKVHANMKMSVSQVLRENDRSRETRVPIVSFRNVNTAVDLIPGQLEVLSELTAQKTVRLKSGLPYLCKIPYLGPLLFSHTSEEIVDTKLYIVGGVEGLQKELIKEYEALKQKVRTEQIKPQ